MKLRKVLFWAHLSAGVVAGLFLLIMSISGLLLTYENKMVEAVARSEVAIAPAGGSIRTVDDIANMARARSKGAMVIMLEYVNRNGAPVTVHPMGKGDLHELALNPYTGEDFKGASAGTKAFFAKVVSWHRWLGLEGNGRGVGRMLTGAANFLFLFLVLSGIYLWWPKAWKWVLLRPKVLFRRNPPPGKARDYNWHHVFSFWALVPLLLIVSSGVIISYSWANAALYRAYGAEPPKQGGPAIIGDLRKDAEMPVSGGADSKDASLQTAFNIAVNTAPNWKKVSLFVHPKAEVPLVRLIVHTGDGVLPEQMTTLLFDRRTNRITEVRHYDDSSPAERARMWVRFAHTGEQFGIIGSTIAGLATLAAAFLVYTGLALAIRRLIEHRQKKQRIQSS